MADIFEESYRVWGTNNDKIKSLFDKAKGRCHYCGCLTLLKPTVEQKHRQATRDHVLPKTRGGTNDEDNIVLACHLCNKVKYDMTGEEFLHVITHKELHPTYVEYVKKSIVKRVLHGYRPSKHRWF